MLCCQLTAGTSWWMRTESFSASDSHKHSAPSAGVGKSVNERPLFSLLLEALFGFSLKHWTDALMTVPISGKCMPQ